MPKKKKKKKKKGFKKRFLSRYEIYSYADTD